MATILMLVSWIFCLRPITWLLRKIISNDTVLGFMLEIFYLGMAVLYLALTAIGIRGLVGFNSNTDDAVGIIFALIFGILGMLSLGYGIMHYHKTTEYMSETEHDGYEGSATYNSSSDKFDVTVREKTKESFSLEGLLAVLTSPLQVFIRFLNLILMFRCVFNDDYVCDLAMEEHPDSDGLFKMIFIDIVNINRY